MVFTLLSIGVVLLWRTHALLHLVVATLIGIASLRAASHIKYRPSRHAVKRIQVLIIEAAELLHREWNGAVACGVPSAQSKSKNGQRTTGIPCSMAGLSDRSVA